MTTEQLYDIYTRHPEVCTDTRKIIPGCIFFALKGENFNANAFASQALAAGAAYAVIDDKDYLSGENCILVDDVLTSLQMLGRHHRNQFDIPFIGITGTNGKTTTKELLNAVLSQHYKTYATTGNLNNHIGVPLTLLAIKKDVEVAIIEMGANHQKEISFLCSIARPTHGLITNVGKAHLEGFGGFEGVKIAKGELYEYLAQSGGIVFLNRDNNELVAMSRKANVAQSVCYGRGSDCYVNGNLANSTPFLTVSWKRELMEMDDTAHIAVSNLTGIYNLENILAAICVGCFLKLSPEEINRGVSSYQPANNRSQIVKTAKNTLICDYYNANPSSMAVALDNLASMPDDERKAMILGDMFELGDETGQEHRAMLDKAMQIKGRRIFVGNEFYKLSGTAGAEFYQTTEAAAAALQTRPVEGATVLVKGSRGMKLESLASIL